ncbi:MAG: hypothetical protein U0T32_01465 [Chitinophagales bacterium]
MEKIFIGIDVSKESLDICIKKGTDFSFEKIDNTVSAVNRFVKQFRRSKMVLYWLWKTPVATMSIYMKYLNISLGRFMS